MSGFIGGIVTNWASTAIQGATTAAMAYGGNLAGDVVSGAGNLIESTGRGVGNSVSGYADRYGQWINGHGDSLTGFQSSLPKSGPLSKQAGGSAPSTANARKVLPRTNSSPASTSAGSKALTKTSGNKPPAKPVARSGTSGVAKPEAQKKYPNGYSGAASAVKSSPSVNKAVSKPEIKPYPSTVTNRGASALSKAKDTAKKPDIKPYSSTVTNRGASAANGVKGTVTGGLGKVTPGIASPPNASKPYPSKAVGMPSKSGAVKSASSYKPSGSSYGGPIPGFGGDKTSSSSKPAAKSIASGGGHIPGF